MTASVRQERYRKRIKEQGLVDIRVEVPATIRDRIKAVAMARNSTMKEEIRKALEELAATATL